MARPKVEANLGAIPGANRRANGREMHHAQDSGPEMVGVSPVRDNLAGPEVSLRSLASAIVELAIQILGDEKLEEEGAA